MHVPGTIQGARPTDSPQTRHPQRSLYGSVASLGAWGPVQHQWGSRVDGLTNHPGSKCPDFWVFRAGLADEQAVCPGARYRGRSDRNKVAPTLIVSQHNVRNNGDALTFSSGLKGHKEVAELNCIRTRESVDVRDTVGG